MNYIDIKIGEERYIQRSEFSKMTIKNDNGAKYFINNLNELPEFQQNIIKVSLKIKENPDKYFEYKEEKEKITITKYLGNLKHIVIPDKINGKTVCGIEKIFNKEDKIEAIILPDTITSLPMRFCQELSKLRFVQLSKNIKEIPIEGFSKCQNLKYINLENIKEIGAYGFFSCGNLENANLKNIEIIRPFGFLYCISLSAINLSNIKNLFPHAFSFCEGLKTVILNDNIKTIQDFTFSNCSSLEDIKFPSNLSQIGRNAFYGCESLTTINLPEGLKKIDESAFQKSGLSGTLNLPKTLVSIGPCAFFNGKLREVNLSKKTKYKQNSFYFPYVDVKRYEEKKKDKLFIIGEER